MQGNGNLPNTTLTKYVLSYLRNLQVMNDVNKKYS